MSPKKKIPEQLSQRAYAAHRGCSHSTVRDRIKRGALTKYDAKKNPTGSLVEAPHARHGGRKGWWLLVKNADVEWEKNRLGRGNGGTFVGEPDLYGKVRNPADEAKAKALGREAETPTGTAFEASASKARWEAKRAEITVRTLAGELVHRDQLQKRLAAIVVRFRERLRSLPARAAAVAAPLDEPAEIQVKLRPLVDDAIRVLAAELRELAGDDENERSAAG